MSIFALVASITPGPVNIVTMTSSVNFGFKKTMPYVVGASIGFTALLLLIGLGLHELLNFIPNLTFWIKLAGAAFLFYMAWMLFRSGGDLSSTAPTKAPSFMHGFLLQWLNPKAWIAIIAGVGALTSDGGVILVWIFAALYFVICFVSIACWAFMGAFLSQYLQETYRVKIFNKIMGLMLFICAVYLLFN